VELAGHPVEPLVPPRPRPTWAWSQTISLTTASEPEAAGASRTLRVTGSDASQPVRSSGVPGWAWKVSGAAVMPAVVFAEPLVAVEDAALPAPAPSASARDRRGRLAGAAMTVVVAMGALLAGAGVLHVLSTGGGGSMTAARAAQPQGLAPAAAPPLAIAPAPAEPILPAERAPVTGGGGSDLPDVLLDPMMATLPVVHPSTRAALPLPRPLGAPRGGAAADAAALAGTLGVPGAGPVALGPLAPASATTLPRSRARAASRG
jgi:hypothetical protein